MTNDGNILISASGDTAFIWNIDKHGDIGRKEANQYMTVFELSKDQKYMAIGKLIYR